MQVHFSTPSLSPIKKIEEEAKEQLPNPYEEITMEANPHPSPLALFSLTTQGPQFPKSVSELTIINPHIGGSTGAKLVQDKAGRKFVLKTAGQNQIIQVEHLEREYATTQAYQALGVPVPDQKLYYLNEKEQIKWGNASLIMLSAYLPGNTVELQDYLNASNLTEMQTLVQKNFVADCLLANWDVIGLNYDNIRIDVETKKIWRVDNGSGLDYRAQGAKKGTAFSENVGELHSFRDPAINFQSASLFGTITDEEIQRQIKEILTRREAFLKAIPEDLKGIMEARLNNLSNITCPLG